MAGAVSEVEIKINHPGRNKNFRLNAKYFLAATPPSNYPLYTSFLFKYSRAIWKPSALS